MFDVSRGGNYSDWLQSMAEAGKILHTDKEFTYRALGKQLRLTDRTVLDAAYNAQIKAL